MTEMSGSTEGVSQMKRIAFLSLMALGLMVRPAFATSILVTGNTSFTVNWLNVATNPDLAGSARFTITGFSATGFNLTVDQITNSTASSPDIGARLVSF